MNGKMHSETGAFSSDGMRAEILNPFVHKLELDNTYDKIKTAIFTVILLPFRVIVILYLIVTAWFLACIGLYGLSEEDLRKKPMTGWRSKLRFYILSLMRLVVVAAGFHRVRVVGRDRAADSPRDAPVIVIAPHSSFFDAIAIVCLGAPSVVAKADTARLPFIGQLINYTQPVYVWRDDPNSRQNTIKEIIERATSKEDWPQVLIFPEGTCTNRSCLITFKPGGFYPGVPVQPVTIRYPNARDTVTWTWEGPGALKLLWLTLTQVHSSCEIEFLPVYYPNEAEKKDPKLYARNVRDVMARALGVPVLDYTYDDCRLIARAKQLHIPGGAAAREVAEARQQLGLDRSGLDAGWCGAGARWVTREQFGERLGVPDHPALHKLFDIFVQRSSGLVYFPDYLLCTCFLVTQHAPLTELISYAFKLYDSSGSGRVQMTDFEEIATKCVGLSVEDAHNVFQQADAEEKGYLTYDEFISFAQKRSDFAFIFVSDTSHKPKSQ
ncbi:PREDICTED: 1-acylglycerophosphocholine O-acyltransferase 1 isoform X1 [Papilio xuthus]|uniref:1-acylglycerophosphocholine O-acyltransferase 1 isoform X1 n=1 Tax=Papilio xuthus TaxID=66420 RepID=A0AAJ7ED85_PAPXU|nr:PREDICTED: 1-acylglycerophosphocholine O-acyltransferase 1 isoform X1 [Papilio xuthus]